MTDVQGAEMDGDRDPAVLDCYIVTGGNSWARDRHADTAFRLWVDREGPRGEGNECVVWKVDSEAYLDETGRMYAAGSKKLLHILIPADWLKQYHKLDVEMELFYSVPVSEAEEKEA